MVMQSRLLFKLIIFRIKLNFFHDMSPLELRHLRMFQALVESGNLSRAAQRLYLTQSALSHQIRVLEEFYGAPLFERKTQPLRLTGVGQHLHRLSVEVLTQVQDTERDIARIVQGQSGRIRVAVECHTCFEWLMPAMDVYREHWPDVELDLVSGFHPSPMKLLSSDRADLVIMSERPDSKLACHPLFRFEIVAVLSRQHRLAGRTQIMPGDFREETLVTYPVPDHMLDVLKHFLKPKGINPKRRTAELTVAILQLVASRRGIAALPRWAVHTYLSIGYVLGKRLGRSGLYGELYAVSLQETAQTAYLLDFVNTVRNVSFSRLSGLMPLLA